MEKKKKTKTPNPSSSERLSNAAWGGQVNKRQNWDSNPDRETGREFKEALRSDTAVGDSGFSGIR